MHASGKRNGGATVLILLLFLLAGGTGLHGQFTLSGEFRPRTEYSHGYGTLAGRDQNPSVFTSQRTRLDFLYDHRKLKTGLVLQDVRIWGSQPQLVTNEDYATSIHQAWLQYEVWNGLFVRAGRQQLSYDNQRILGAVGWAQQARSHDLVLLKFEGPLSVHAGLAYHENTNRRNNLYDGPDAYKTMQFIWFNGTKGILEWSFLFLNNGIPYERDVRPGEPPDQGISFSQTFGPLVSIRTGLLDLTTEGYFQGGGDADQNRLRAWYGHLQAAFNLDGGWSLTAGYEYLSGNDYNGGGTNRAFSPLYGTNHKFNGYMDYFYVGNHTNSVGLQDLFLKSGKSMERLDVGAHLHLFLPAGMLPDEHHRYLGTELDLFFSWKVDPSLSFSGGYSQMLASESMEFLKGGDPEAWHNWAWLMVTVKPQFFASAPRSAD